VVGRCKLKLVETRVESVRLRLLRLKYRICYQKLLSNSTCAATQWFQTLAWKRRAEDPLILVRTSASGADAGRHPEVTATPRSVWEARGGATFEAGLR